MRRVELDDDIPVVQEPVEDVLAVDLALQELAGQDCGERPSWSSCITSPD